MSADLTSIIERIARYCESLESALSPRPYFTGSYAKADADYRAAIDELRQLNAPEWNEAHRHERRLDRDRPADPLHDTEQAMSRGWR